MSEYFFKDGMLYDPADMPSLMPANIDYIMIAILTLIAAYGLAYIYKKYDIALFLFGIMAGGLLVYEFEGGKQ